MENLIAQVPTSGFGTVASGSGLDIVHGLVQCYGDLSLPECVLCITQVRTVIPLCYPFNSTKYTGPSDTAVCGNRTQKSFAFQVSARKAVVQVVSEAPNRVMHGLKFLCPGQMSQLMFLLTAGGHSVLVLAKLVCRMHMHLYWDACHGLRVGR
ncbi:Uncharacterized protein Fot_33895 [Forsythia ovata]|uniref:Gnk2-homologous domain-containing protein n=1 Tax=Forsythia ovata TaxID=205694 RepID=A0ABD1TCI4_9LAMI